MKKLLFSLVILLVATYGMKAQETLTTGYLKMEITDVGSDNEQMAAALEMMKGTQTEFFFNDGKTLTKMNMMGGMVEMTTLANTTTGKTDLLFNAMGQKMHIESTKEERETLQNEQAAAMKYMKVTYDEEDKMNILGYDCIKATFSSPQMVGNSFSMYVTKDIKAEVQGIQLVENLEFEGFPMMIVVKGPQMSMTMKAVDLKKEVDAGVFDIDTGGYQKMSMKEFQEKVGAMGGMGF